MGRDYEESNKALKPFHRTEWVKGNFATFTAMILSLSGLCLNRKDTSLTTVQLHKRTS